MDVQFRLNLDFCQLFQINRAPLKIVFLLKLFITTLKFEDARYGQPNFGI